MTEPSQPSADKHLDTTTTMSCKREPVCFAYLCADAVTAPVGIDRFNFDIASADYHQGRASVWGTLEIRADLPEAEATAILGFDDTFLRPFSRAVLEAGSTRMTHRLRVAPEPGRTARPRVVDYVRSTGGSRLRDMIVTPYDQILSIAVTSDESGEEETLFQLPRSDSFLRMFARMAHLADMALRDTLNEMERLAREAPDAPIRRLLR
jgi:hypothetical protein